MAIVKKWKVRITTSSKTTATNTFVYIDAPSSSEAMKIAKMQYPNASHIGTPSEEK
ncbi:MAG: hypothetical protein WBM13_01415 [Bacteroidia bacterium]